MYIDVILRNKGRFSDMLFTYEVPPFLMDEIRKGIRVIVPFGQSNKPIESVVVDIKYLLDESIDKEKIKMILDIMDNNVVFDDDQIELLTWIRNRYMCTYNDSLNLFYPKGYKYTSKKVIVRSKNVSLKLELDDIEKKIFDELYNNTLEYESTLNNYGAKVLNSLVKKGCIDIRWKFESSDNIKLEKYICLKKPVEFIQYEIDNNKRLGTKQIETLKFLINNNIVEFQVLSELFNITSSTIKSLESKDLITVEEKEVFRKSKTYYKTDKKIISLNKGQKVVVDRIISDIKKGDRIKPYLLYGVTGSGKTEVFLELIDYTLSQGQDAMFLVPEISLTPQTISRVKNRFGNIVGVYHSQLSEGEKYDLYREVKNENIRIVIGTRSAVFLPFKSLGMVIIDEEHDSSYKSDKTPKYDTIEIARYFSFKKNIPIVLGSATPDIGDYYKAIKGEYTLLKMENRVNNSSLPKIEVVDMRDELHSGNTSVISRTLEFEIKNALERKEQVILFLNKRGYANVITCKDCGHSFKCIKCDITLTNHKFNSKAVCHYCGYEENIPTVCPKCNGDHLGNVGTGTEKIEEIITQKFPKARVLRVDKDNTTKKGQMEKLLSKFNSGEADILVGTQMLSKGHDFKNVTLVGIISADMMLNYPDYKAFETTFQLITQVSGRAGRSEKEGKVILQTYNTDNFAIKSAVEHDYESFYKNEIKLRKVFGYEPYNNILRIVFSGKDINKVKTNSFKFIETLKYLYNESGLDVTNSFLGPNECSISKINDKYRWQVIIKDYNVNIKIIKSMVKYISVTKFEEIFDKDINMNIELNPNSFI